MLYFGDIGQRVRNTFTEVDCYTSVIENRSTLATQEIGDFAAVTSIHKGDYATIGDTYQSMMDWASRSSLKLQGASYERYIIDPWSTNQAENYITELILPIRGV
ncbi:Bacterial transcription activator, effector binding domain [compost metagenome]